MDRVSLDFRGYLCVSKLCRPMPWPQSIWILEFRHPRSNRSWGSNPGCLRSSGVALVWPSIVTIPHISVSTQPRSNIALRVSQESFISNRDSYRVFIVSVICLVAVFRHFSPVKLTTHICQRNECVPFYRNHHHLNGSLWKYVPIVAPLWWKVRTIISAVT